MKQKPTMKQKSTPFLLFVVLLLVSCISLTGCKYQLSVRDNVKTNWQSAVHIVTHPQETIDNLKQKYNEVKVHFMFKRNVEIVVPKVAGKIPDGSKITNKFKGINGAFVLIASQNIQVFHKNSEKAVNLSSLPMSTRVRPIYIEKKEFTFQGEPWKWAFVLTEDGTDNVGWVNVYGLGFTYDFYPVYEWFYENLKFCRQDYCADYHFNEEGWFYNDWEAEGAGIKLAGKARGRLYQYKTLIWAKKRTDDEWADIFLTDSEDRIFPEIKFKDITLTYE